MKGYPVFLTGLDTKRCVVIGGGLEAERKVAGLLECAASVTVISPDLTPTLRLWVEDGTIAWLSRPYQPGTCRGPISSSSRTALSHACCHLSGS